MVQNRERDIIRSFIGLSDDLVGDFDILDLAIRLVEDCARLLDVAAAGLLLADPGGVLHLLAATSEHARSLEVFQLQREEGPCLDAFHTGKQVGVPDVEAEATRWPRFAIAAAQEGFASVHAIPMRLRDDVLGALNLFGTSPGILDGDDLNLAQALAHVATLALVRQNDALTAGSVLPGLQAAVASRATLEIAKGVLAEVLKIDPQEAFLRLRGYAHDHGEHLTTLAHTVVAGDPTIRLAVFAALAEAANAR